MIINKNSWLKVKVNAGLIADYFPLPLTNLAQFHSESGYALTLKQVPRSTVEVIATVRLCVNPYLYYFSLPEVLLVSCHYFVLKCSWVKDVK